VVFTSCFCLIAFSKLAPTWTCKSQTWLQPSSFHSDVSLLLWRQWHYEDVRQMKNCRWQKSNQTHFSETQILFDFPRLFWTEQKLCIGEETSHFGEKGNIWICVFSAWLPAQPQDKIIFFLNQQSRESKRQLQQVTDWVHGEQCSVEIPCLLGYRKISGACFSCESVKSSSQMGSFRCLWHAQITDRPDTGPVGELQEPMTSQAVCEEVSDGPMCEQQNQAPDDSSKILQKDCGSKSWSPLC